MRVIKAWHIQVQEHARSSSGRGADKTAHLSFLFHSRVPQKWLLFKEKKINRTFMKHCVLYLACQIAVWSLKHQNYSKHDRRRGNTWAANTLRRQQLEKHSSPTCSGYQQRGKPTCPFIKNKWLEIVLLKELVRFRGQDIWDRVLCILGWPCTRGGLKLWSSCLYPIMSGFICMCLT